MTPKRNIGRAALLCFACALCLLLKPAHADWQVVTPAPTQEKLRAVWGASAGAVFAVGDYGTIVKFEGSSWTPLDSGVYIGLYGMWGSSASNLFVAADQGYVLHSTDGGAAWNPVQTPSNNKKRLRDIWGFADDSVFAVGDSGTILFYDGSAWQSMTSPTPLTLQGAWGTSESNVFAVGGPSASTLPGGAIIIRYDGTAWTASLERDDPAVAEDRFHDAWGSSPDNLFVVGEAGVIVHISNGGTLWSDMANPAQGAQITLRDIWGASANDIFAVGDNSTILHYNGSQWSKMDVPESGLRLHGVWGSSGSDVYAVGDNASGAGNGVILHYTNDPVTSSSSSSTSSSTSTSSTTSSSSSTTTISSTTTTIKQSGGGGGGSRTTTTSVAPATSTSSTVTTTTTTVAPAPETTTTTSPATTTSSVLACVFTETLGGEYIQQLELFRDFRNSRLLQSAAGQKLVFDYYRYSLELVGIFRQNPELVRQLRQLMISCAPLVKEGLAQDRPIVLSVSQYQDALRLLEAVRIQSSAGLSGLITRQEEEMRAGRTLMEIGVVIE